MISEFCVEVERILCCKKVLELDDEQEIPLKFTNNKFWSGFLYDEMNQHLDLNQNITKKSSISPNLPIEIIIKIILNLDNIEDIKTCMLLSKNIRKSIFKTPEIMRRILFTINCPEFLKLLDTKGSYIRCLKIQTHYADAEDLKNLLTKVPNLEELTFKNGQLSNRFSRQNSKLIQESNKSFIQAELPNLKNLEIKSANFEIFTKSTKNVTKLAKFSIYLTELNHDDKISEFLALQSALQELNIINISQFLILDFLCHIFSFEAIFKLKILKLNRIKLDTNFDKFLKCQLDHLEELELTEVKNLEILEIIFKKSKKLKKLSLGSAGCCMLFSSEFPDLKIQSLDHFEDRNSKGVELDKIHEKFPNLQSLKCLLLTAIDGTFDSIFNLDVFVFDCQKLQNLELPSLKKLTIAKISRFDDEKNWQKFTKNVKNLQNLTIKHVEDQQNVPQILKHLKNFQNLKFFNLKQASYYDDYEITIDTKDRIVKTLRSTVEKNQEILKTLHENFDEFEFFEFKSFIGKIKKFDIVVQLDKH